MTWSVLFSTFPFSVIRMFCTVPCFFFLVRWLAVTSA